MHAVHVGGHCCSSFHNILGLILLFHVCWEEQWGGSNSIKASGADRGNSVSNDISKKPGVSLLPPQLVSSGAEDSLHCQLFLLLYQ